MKFCKNSVILGHNEILNIILLALNVVELLEPKIYNLTYPSGWALQKGTIH